MKQLFLTAVILIAGFSACKQKDQISDSFFEDFSGSSSGFFRHNSFGDADAIRYTYGAESPTEPGTKIISFRIDPEGPAGAGRGPEIISKDYTHFGTYATRLKVPDVRDIQPDAGVVVGYFTYHMDSISGLSEVDWEWLIADPEVIYVGTWTGPRGDLRRIGRTINMAKGIIYNTSYRENLSGTRRKLTGIQSLPDTIPAIEGFDASSQFHTYGFDWYPDRIRWWMIHPATADTVVLWDYKGSSEGIPLNKTRYRMNFWHTNNWPVETNPNSIEKPLHPYELEVDWMSYDPLE
jgi:hypothetical protein